MKCPGQDTRFWRPEDIYEIPCPQCHQAVEFFKTDIKRICPNCGEEILNSRTDFSCAEWCEEARKCLGPTVYGQWMEKKKLEEQRKADLERLLAMVDPEDVEVKRLFQRLYHENNDPKRLLNIDRLRLMRNEKPELVKKAARYYSRFVKRSS